MGGHGLYQHIVVMLMFTVWMTTSFWATGLPVMLAPPTFWCGDHECTEAEACESPERVYAPNSKHTMTREFHLVCETGHVVQVLELLFLSGVMMGSYCWGWAATKWGRKPVLLITQLVHCCVFFSAISVPSFTWIYGISWVAGIAMAGLLVADVIILTEAVDSQYRNWYSGISFCGWGMGAAGIAFYASQTDSWRTVALTAGLVSLAVVPLLFWLDESLPYLVAMSRDKEKIAKVLKRIAAYNGRTYDPAIESKVAVDEEPDVSVKALFQESWIFKRFLRMAGVWVAAVVGYYGILFCLPTYIGNIYTNGIVLGLSEVPANMVTAFSLNSLGRRSTTQLLLSVGGLACATAHLAAVINSAMLQTGALFLARFMMTALYLLIYVYTSELFPTSLRSLAMGMCTAVGNLGGLLAPNLVLLSQLIGIAPLVIISVILFLCCWVGWGLPETKGVELSDVGKDEKQPNFDYTPLTSD